MRRPIIKRGGSALALAIAPGVSTASTDTWLWLAHAPIAGAIVVAIAGGLGTVTAAVVAIVKIRTDRTPEQMHAESQAALAKKVTDKREAMLLTTVDALVIKQADVTGSEKNILTLMELLLRQLALLDPRGSVDLPPPAMVSDICPPSGPANTDGQVTDEQIKKILDEHPDTSADALMVC